MTPAQRYYLGVMLTGCIGFVLIYLAAIVLVLVQP